MIFNFTCSVSLAMCVDVLLIFFGVVYAGERVDRHIAIIVLTDILAPPAEKKLPIQVFKDNNILYNSHIITMYIENSV
jgi:hypothetical protein